MNVQEAYISCAHGSQQCYDLGADFGFPRFLATLYILDIILTRPSVRLSGHAPQPASSYIVPAPGGGSECRGIHGDVHRSVSPRIRPAILISALLGP